ncbi:PREDICTED: frizzled-5-like [Branchiostoma belcheri]|uniref:Frizzled-5-like n=1 Tax=Branchiostoma belcheri TaxID=7741 RepID=A0A6P4ZJ58_BRABE|nr:PREDICTED: frizzled-5-like [Branchiostoma belcheri]
MEDPTCFLIRQSAECEPIQYSGCMGLPYSQTSFPNIFGWPNQGFALQTAPFVFPAYDPISDCHPDLNFFLCSILFPQCTTEGQRHPCKSFCYEMNATCGERALALGLPWEDWICATFSENSCAVPNEDSTTPPTPMDGSTGYTDTDGITGSGSGEAATTQTTITVFDYGAAVTAYDNLEATLGPDIAAELGMSSFRQDLDLYAEFDGTPLANLPNISGIIIQPERWSVPYDSGEGVTTGLFLPETRNFDPNVGLPAELPSSAIAAVRDNYPQFFNRYLPQLGRNYATMRDDVEFDEETYGPDAICPYPPRTELGGGFGLQRIPPALCFPILELEVADADPAARTIVIVTIEVIGDVIWIEILVFRSLSTE